MDRNDLRIITRLMFRLLPMQILLGLNVLTIRI